MTMLGKINLSFTCLMAFTMFSSYLVVTSAHQVDERELNSRIIGGTIADAKRYPYYTYLEITSTSFATSTCGGSLVAPDMVLTAAHCVQGSIFSIIAVVNYTLSYSTGYITGYEYYRNSYYYYTHKSFDSETFANDIALLKLDTPVIGVSLLNLNDKSNVPNDGISVTAVGHGRTSNAATPTLPIYLMEVSIPIISIDDCNDSNSWNGFITDELVICAGPTAGGKGVCQGDSGGPLIIRGNSASQDIQVGITSFGRNTGCALANYPSGFTRVSYYIQWIQSAICESSNFKPTYCSVAPQPTKTPTNKPPTPKPRPVKRPTPVPTTVPTKKIVRTRPPTLR
jgi:secreted trypsin-like serine protease